ncbi:hypothetical protein [Leptolyngbya sp. KIOST-1]|uniref:hypothetical protein n=1 Tax=Leptolyngbya sp. KIOST-1 TaxID=1229172 RepID=UPI000562F534|nr:hypothetical protein [Leptolyngbya sp. KIOST-1]
MVRTHTLTTTACDCTCYLSGLSVWANAWSIACLRWTAGLLGTDSAAEIGRQFPCAQAVLLTDGACPSTA